MGDAVTTVAGAGHGGQTETVAAAEPRWSRVAVSAPGTQIDIALPADVPVAALIPAVAELIERRTPAGAAAAPPGPVTLVPVGRAALDPELSLAEQQVRDGDLLVWTETAAAPPPPLFDDVVAAVVRAGAVGTAAWTDRCAVVGGRAAIVAGAVAAAAAVLVGGPGGFGAAVLVALAAVAVVGAGLCARIGHDTATAIALGLAGVVMAGAAGFTAGGGAFASGMLSAGAGAGSAAVVARTVTGAGRTVFVAAALIGAGIAGAAGAAAWTTVAGPRIGAGLLLGALALSLAAPRIAVLTAGIPLPPVPSREESVVDTGAEEAITATAELSVRAGAATAVIDAAAAATAVLTLVAVPITVGAGTAAISVSGLILAVTVSAALVVRGRGHRDRFPAGVLIGAGVAGVFATAITAAALAPDHTGWAAGGIGLVAAATAAGGIVAARTDVSPVLRRAGEVVGYAVITAVVPVAAAVFGLYAWARGL